MSGILDTAVFTRYSMKVLEAETQERMKFLWELADRLGMEPVDSEFGELFLGAVPTAKQLCAFIDKSEPEGFRVVTCSRTRKSRSMTS